MKKALLWVMLSLFCNSSFSWSLTWTPDLPVESTTHFENTMDCSKRIAALKNYAVTVFKNISSTKSIQEIKTDD